MKAYNGIINLIGNGAWIADANGTRLTVLEIGEKSLKKIFMPDYLANYVRAGNEARLLVFKFITHSQIVAAEVNGKKYKVSLRRMVALSFIPAVLVTLVVGSFIGIITLEAYNNFMLGFKSTFFLASVWSLKNIYEYIAF